MKVTDQGLEDALVATCIAYRSVLLLYKEFAVEQSIFPLQIHQILSLDACAENGAFGARCSCLVTHGSTSLSQAKGASIRCPENPGPQYIFLQMLIGT